LIKVMLDNLLSCILLIAMKIIASGINTAFVRQK
jgi:hypothetical protein